GHLAFVVRRFDQPAIDVSESARQRERVYVARIDHLEGVTELRVLELGRNRFDQATTDPLNVILDFAVVKQRQLSLDLVGGLLSKLQVFINAVGILGSYDAGLTEDADRQHERAYQRQHADAFARLGESFHINLRS